MAEAKKLKQISLKEFKKHGTPDDLWLCIRGKVLDVTKYQEDHPGSDTILQDMAGKDATLDFDDVGHTSDAKTLRDELVIGEMSLEDQKQLPGYSEHGEENEAEAAGGGMSMILIVVALLAVLAGVYASQQA
eukprot:TRINITY_DN43102_c0_g1_i1.p1 TRINITY_DN43102_c0_g1~~TRINITY_DN43102_c0_g1_i1.p1  ORF type:complete len:132 (-),score=42.88 TRINITY_DN43102_c0_g1_i1:430-825(-)